MRQGWVPIALAAMSAMAAVLLWAAGKVGGGCNDEKGDGDGEDGSDGGVGPRG